MKKTEPNSSFDNLSVCLYSYSTIAMQPRIKSRHTKKKHKKKSWGLQNPKKTFAIPNPRSMTKTSQAASNPAAPTQSTSRAMIKSNQLLFQQSFFLNSNSSIAVQLRSWRT
jgi:hypothetical protein